MPSAVCPTCGHPLPGGAPAGLCPRCLLRQGLTEPSPAPGGEPFTPPGPAELAPLFPQLEILELLGVGGMGAVYKARQVSLDRTVALKVLTRPADEAPAFAERFAREARTLARLGHPNIVAVHDSGRAGDLYYLVMEYVDGVDLRRALRQGLLPAAEAVCVVRQVLGALAFAHEQGVVHRDIKPENILLTARGMAKVVDFGLAKLLARAPAELSLTSTQQVLGTWSYMAPEQLERPQEVDHRADIYSTGMVLYELLTGELPRGSFVPPSAKSAVDPRVDQAVLRALAREPERRYQRAADMARDLEAASAPLPNAPEGEAGARPRGRRRWPLVLGGVVAACVLLGALGWRLFRPALAGDVLRWGGDAGGGAPYIYHDRGGRFTGFEVELADHLAKRLGKRPQFVQKEWTQLPQDLQRGDVDMVLNGYEWFPERERVMRSTIPYYTYKLALLVPRGSWITTWADLRRHPAGRKVKVGVLADSAAHRYVQEEFGADVGVTALGDEGTTGVMGLVKNVSPADSKGLDATVQDLPVAVHYTGKGREFPDLLMVGGPAKPAEYSHYVIFVRREDEALRERLNGAIEAALRDGTLERLYRSYGLWDADQARLLEVARDWPPPAPAAVRTWGEWFGVLRRCGLLLGVAALWTVALACLAMPLAMALGLVVAVGRLYGPRWLDAVLGGYVELLRGTPVLLQVLVIYYVLPRLGVYFDPFGAGVTALALNYSAYEAENYRAGLLAVPAGQMEAALALGMSPWAALRRIIIPQAVRIVVPPVTNDFISLFKDTAVCTVIGVGELAFRYRNLANDNPGLVAQLGLMTAGLYLLMSYPLSLLARRLERRLNKG
jgi:polar amino acid transport system substrate-binding protein